MAVVAQVHKWGFYRKGDRPWIWFSLREIKYLIVSFPSEFGRVS